MEATRTARPVLLHWYPFKLAYIPRAGKLGWIEAEVDAETGEAIFELADGTVIVAAAREYLLKSDHDAPLTSRTSNRR